MMSQTAVARRIAPLVVEYVEDTDELHTLYSFEPGATELFDALLPRYITTRVYAALLESAASELASRQRAMKSATDNADELIKKLVDPFETARGWSADDAEKAVKPPRARPFRGRVGHRCLECARRVVRRLLRYLRNCRNELRIVIWAAHPDARLDCAIEVIGPAPLAPLGFLRLN